MTTPGPFTAGVRRAVLIGIDAYTTKPLDGCVADATMMAEVLETKFSFEKVNITLMLNEAARRDAVLSELDQLVDLTQASDVAFIFYAGHGSQSINSDNTESSGYDSTFNVSDNPREDILDDEIAERLAALGEKTQFTVMVVDACNSGTLGRSAETSGKERWSPPITRAELPAAALQARGAARAASRSAAPSSYVLFTACRDGEIAQEIIIPGEVPAHHGAMSFALVHELQRAVSGDTWREVFDRVSRTVSSVHKQQHPQIDGAIDREIFGLRELPPMPFVAVTDRASTSVVLGAGSLQGVIQGSTYTVYPDGTKDVTGVESLGTVEVMLVKGTTSRARIVSEKATGAIVIGARSVTPQRGTVAAALALENTDPKSRMTGGVTLQILRRDANGAWDVAANDETHSMPVFDSGDRIAFRITSALDEPVFVNLFDFDPSGTVSTKTKGWANQLKPNGVFEIGTDTRKISMRWDADDAVETFKVFASVRQLDMSWLLQLEQPARGAEDIESLNVDDWCAAVAPIRIRRKLEIPADGRGVAVAGATLTGRGLTGTVRSATNDTAATMAPTGPLAQAIADAGMLTQQSLVITDAKPTGDGTRSANGAPTVELQVPDPGDGFAQVALTTDASGMVSWHFAPLDDAPPTRDGSMPTLRTRTFTFDAKPTTGAGDGERGLVSMIGQKLINVYVFPAGKKLVEHLAAKYGERLELEKTPYRIRTFRADNYTTDAATEIDSAAWQSLGTGRALLMIHGTNSRTHTAFGGLPRAFVDAMHTLYGGRVFAFDHPTLTHTPRQNIETLLEAMPDGMSLDVDIICHSRGGLVSRVLAEKQAELTLGSRKIRVGRVVFVGSPNAGTRLADEAFIGDYLDTVTNLLNLVPTNGVTDALGFVLTGVKLVATGLWSGLKGLHSMQPDGTFGAWLNTGTRERDTKYFALASDYTPTQTGLIQLATDKLMDRVFKGAHNDLVVPTDGVFAANGSGYFPISEQVVFGATDGVPHTGFFQYPKTTELIATWLRS